MSEGQTRERRETWWIIRSIIWQPIWLAVATLETLAGLYEKVRGWFLEREPNPIELPDLESLSGVPSEAWPWITAATICAMVMRGAIKVIRKIEAAHAVTPAIRLIDERLKEGRELRRRIRGDRKNVADREPGDWEQAVVRDLENFLPEHVETFRNADSRDAPSYLDTGLLQDHRQLLQFMDRLIAALQQIKRDVRGSGG